MSGSCEDGSPNGSPGAVGGGWPIEVIDYDLNPNLSFVSVAIDGSS